MCVRIVLDGINLLTFAIVFSCSQEALQSTT